NIFPITNLNQLSSKYTLYTIRGLASAPDEYYQNCQTIIRRLSFTMRSPVTIIHRDGTPFLVVEEERNRQLHWLLCAQLSASTAFLRRLIWIIRYAHRRMMPSASASSISQFKACSLGTRSYGNRLLGDPFLKWTMSRFLTN